MKSTDPSREKAIRTWLKAEHHRYRPTVPGGETGGMRLPESVRLVGPASAGPLVDLSLSGFRLFLETCLSLKIVPAAGFAFRFSFDHDLAPGGFRAEISEQEVLIAAANERGILDATHYFERELIDRGGSLPLGSFVRHPSLATRFTEGVFAPGHHGVEEYEDGTLELMQHFGSNALRRCIVLGDLWQSKSLPELNAPGASAAIATIRKQAKRLAAAGMDYFLILISKAWPADHPVFQNHPEIRGAREEIFLEETWGRGNHVLCSGHPLVHRAYAEVVTNIYESVPELAGAIVLVGGEGFHHCYMRPAGEELSNCPHCRDRDPHAQVAQLVNTLFAAVKAGAPRARLMAWPYAAFVWSRQDSTESAWIDHLDEGVEVLGNIATGEPDPTNDAGAILYDYNIKIPGPNKRFSAQAQHCRERGLRFHVRTETNTTPDTFFVPHLPVHFRWYERFRAVRESGAAGFMGQWYFYGMNGSIPEELQYHSVWNPERRAEDLLATVARRDFGLKGSAVDEALRAWRLLSDAWDDFPYSAMTSGEREAYMRGPWYLGPAHPLIFNEQSRYDLGAGFFFRRGDLSELLPEGEIEALPGKPRYVCNTLFCLPFGIEEFLRLAVACRDRWERGTQALLAACGKSPTPEAEGEINVCRILACHLHSLVNTAEFLSVREQLGTGPSTAGSFQEAFKNLSQIVEREIANAQNALPLVESDPRLGYGHNYGPVYDSAMIRAKIRQCEFVLSQELPRISSVIRFHVWSQFP